MFFKSLFDSNERQLNKLYPIVKKINLLESDMQNLSDLDFVQKTRFWQNELKNLPYDKHENYLNTILPEAFALVREASKRVLKMRHFDVQLLAGLALHQGKISEQKTGEGKTLTATLPLYLNALTGRGVHLVTPNDYLSRHGAGWMGKLYEFLGLTVGVIMEQQGFVYDSKYQNEKFKDSYAYKLRPGMPVDAYKCDITYGTNSNFGFDYLRDNRAQHPSQVAQVNPAGEIGSHYFAIVDEVDSILIDFARTPLIISTSDAKPSERYIQAHKVVKQLLKDIDYKVDEKHQQSSLTDFGIRKVEKLLGVKNMYEEDFEMVHLVEQTLAANTVYKKDQHYLIKDNRVLIIDQFTGRVLESNRFSEGLHQAIEVKEGVPIGEESKTLASISYQNYFRMYKKLAGMTGTAITEAEEFYKIYNLEVLVIPTNNPISRIDSNDLVFKTEAGKFKAVADEIVERHRLGQPVLVGTTSVEKSELLHKYLQRKSVDHEILNAKNHENEALIIAQAGKKGAVTISTNMAGRGVDIILGGEPFNEHSYNQVKELGGLHVIGTERHESRRIDNQLRGRAGRQGDPGSSRFYISLQDDLMRIFGGAQVENLMGRFGLDDSTPLEASLVSRAIESAQKRVEGFNFDRRKQVVEMDDVMNNHRNIIYELRKRILTLTVEGKDFEEWFLNKISAYAEFDIENNWNKHKKVLGKDYWLEVVRALSLPVIDTFWMEHLVEMDYLLEGINLRGYAQKDPKVEYKNESHSKFDILARKIYATIADRLSKIQGVQQESSQPLNSIAVKNSPQKLQYSSANNVEYGVADEANISNSVSNVKPVTSNKEKIGRNDPCYCGSGKKYKNCHGKAA